MGKKCLGKLPHKDKSEECCNAWNESRFSELGLKLVQGYNQFKFLARVTCARCQSH